MSPAIFNRVQRDFHLITDGDFEITIKVHELVFGDNAFGLQSGVNDDVIAINGDDRSDNDGARL